MQQSDDLHALFQEKNSQDVTHLRIDGAGHGVFGSMHLKQYQQCVNSLIAPAAGQVVQKSLKFKPLMLLRDRLLRRSVLPQLRM